MMKKLEPALNEKRIVKIYDDYINTAYIALITPAVEKMKEIESLGTNKLNQIDDSNLRQKRLQ